MTQNNAQVFDADIDIDIRPDINRENYGTCAIIYTIETEDIAPHKSGIYVEDGMPIDKETGNAAIDYKKAKEWGFHKIDILNNNGYLIFESKEEIHRMAEKTPDWNLLQQDEYLDELPHCGGEARVLLKQIRPQSIEELGDILALIRPGKKDLIPYYLIDRTTTRKTLYTRTDKYEFKKSHAIAYATMIVCLLNKFEST